MKKPTTGNRTTGTLGDYMRWLSRGETLGEIGARYGVTLSAVRKALKAHGLPTCAAGLLREKYRQDLDALAEESGKPRRKRRQAKRPSIHMIDINPR